MSSEASGPSRRAFLTSALAVGASAALVRDGGKNSAVEWCLRPAYPFAFKRCWVRRGALPVGATAHLMLELRGPGLDDPHVLAAQTVVLNDDVTVWDMRLPYEHPQLTPGIYRYRVACDVEGRRMVSRSIEYVITPFTFGV